MTVDQRNGEERRISEAVGELKTLIERHYPTAAFDVFRGEDPDGTYLRVTVDIEDPDDVIEVVLDRLFVFQVEDELPVYVVTTWPPERVAEQLAARSARGGVRPLPPVLPR